MPVFKISTKPIQLSEKLTLAGSVEQKKHINPGKKPKMRRLYNDNKNKNWPLLTYPLDIKYKTNPFYCFNNILIADTLSRKKRKTNMEITTLKKITCSYTGKGLVLSPTELCRPMAALTFITGQSCAIVWATKSVSSWKLRKNSVIGCKVTLRRQQSYVFFNKLYIYGREGLFEKQNNFLNKSFPFHFGISKNTNFIELQKSDRFSANFSGFSISFN